ncbi:DEAD/DEAH box helicase [Wenyingzhuangia sp. 2_MG-2023]|uniref:DEAD/DEAH box helicase n=1 Tax=Wenyingzhuangia sp. 2_MG-2023 TaxID=3062639 RepID=UPI0026E3F7E9|nr:DEAD/DEAH box helicase [Wenyingzhuangia sp. 2_MG-2023]MDO6736547.1 DEAD/DEAH box helicase [Wenyingzhuangia sp. 2_MG-2023]MDO6801158.1 DEAD/DEAH box helicase [Wenyingzhuangia sp. 1_MG-2023]
MSFENLNLNTQLRNAIADLGYTEPTKIQEQAFSSIMSGRDVVGIAQTGTGKTFAYLLPILRMLPFSEQKHPRVLIVVPTRELVVQVLDALDKLTPYINIRYGGIYGGANLNKQKEMIHNGLDILVSTPRRVIDLGMVGALKLKNIQKLVIDEVDEIFNLGFRLQLIDIIDLLPKKKQAILFSATMTEEVSELIQEFFKNPINVESAASGSRLENIEQIAFEVPNFYTKINLLNYLLQEDEDMSRVLVFIKHKYLADLVFNEIQGMAEYPEESFALIHSNKTQNYRLRSVENFKEGKHRVLITTDVLSRGVDIPNITHVINFDLPKEAEAYMHRIGRTGRAENEGFALSFITKKDAEILEEIETLMDYEIPKYEMPEEIFIESKLLEEEVEIDEITAYQKLGSKEFAPGPAFHEKKEKNQKVNLGGSYRRIIAKKYKKPQRRYPKK